MNKNIRNKYSSKRYLYTVKVYKVCFHENIFAYSSKGMYCENHWKKKREYRIPKVEFMCIRFSLIQNRYYCSLRHFLRFVM